MSRANHVKRVGIRDVAAAAGVSATTVSHALNDKGRLPESTRELVREAARRLGYRPNPSAQRLGGGHTGLLGLTIAHPVRTLPATITDVAYFVELLSAASTTALNRGYSLVLSTNDPESDDVWRQTPIDGAVVVDPITDDPIVASLQASGTPVVTTGRVLGTTPVEHWVGSDHVDGTTRLLGHLQRAGAERIALVSAPVRTSYTHDLLAAYTAWCVSQGVDPQVVIVEDDFGVGSGFAAAAKILDGDRPDAILGALDRLTLDALLAAQTRGLRVPDDIMIAGYTDSASYLRTTPAITALHLDPGQIGQRAVELLIDLVEERAPAEGHVVVPPRLTVRGSTRRQTRSAAAPRKVAATDTAA